LKIIWTEFQKKKNLKRIWKENFSREERRRKIEFCAYATDSRVVEHRPSNLTLNSHSRLDQSTHHTKRLFVKKVASRLRRSNVKFLFYIQFNSSLHRVFTLLRTAPQLEYLQFSFFKNCFMFNFRFRLKKKRALGCKHVCSLSLNWHLDLRLL